MLEAPQTHSMAGHGAARALVRRLMRSVGNPDIAAVLGGALGELKSLIPAG